MLLSGAGGESLTFGTSNLVAHGGFAGIVSEKPNDIFMLKRLLSVNIVV